MWSPERQSDVLSKENTQTPFTPSHGKWYGPCTPRKERKAGSPRESPRLSLTMFSTTPRISFGKVKVGCSKLKRVVIDNPLSIAQSLHLVKWPENKGFTILKPVEHGGSCQNSDILERSVEFIITGMNEMDLPILWKPTAEGSYRELVTLNLGDFNRLNVILFGNAVDTTIKSKPKMKIMLPEDITKTASSQKRKKPKMDKQSISSMASKRILRESNGGLPEPKRPVALNENATKPIIKTEHKMKAKTTTSRKFKIKVAAKGVAPTRLNLTKHLTTERSLPRHPLPYAAKNIYYDEKWMEKQERGFIQWLNYVLTPPDELAVMSVSEAETSASIFSNTHDTTSQHLAPTKEVLSLRAYTAKRKMARLRLSACLLYQSPPVALVAKTIESEVEKNRLTIRADKHLHQDLGIKETMVKMLLSYNLLWLRIGLETIYGEVLPLESNNDVAGLKRFLKRRFLANPDIAKEYRHTTVAESYRPGYYEALKRFTLKKFLLLILFLDKAKLTRLIDHDPCLFNKSAEYKSSRLLLLSFSRDYLKGEGDVTKHLGLLNYIVTHEQMPLDEMNYAVTNLAVDLRDGLRITRVIELLTQNWRLSGSLRVPAISRLQKIHNVDVALNALKEQGVLAEEMNAVNPRHIVDGHREKTLSLLWMVILHFQVNQVLNEQQIKEEIAFLRKYHFQRNQHSKQAITENKDDVYCKTKKLGLLLEWCRSVCRLFSVKVDNFTVSMSDGRVMCYLLHFYHPSLVREEDICQETTLTCNPYTTENDSLDDDSLHSKDESLAHCETQDESSARLSQLKDNERKNHELLRKKVKELGGVPAMLRVADLSCTIPDEKVIITYLSYLCARLLDLRLEGRAALIIQVAWRKYRDEKQAKEVKRRDQAASVIQTRFRLFLEKKRQKVILHSTVIIQAFVRGYQARCELRHRQHAATVIQSYYRSLLITQRTRQEFMNLKQATLRMQTAYRGKIARRRVRRTKAARLIQSNWRGFLDRRQFLAVKRSAVVIQSAIRRLLVMRRLQKLKTASVAMQRRYRAKLLATRTKSEFTKLKAVVTTLQARCRGNSARREVRRLRATIIVQKSAKMWLCRREFLKTKMIITKLQATVRKNVAQRRYKKLLSAAVVIQRRWQAYTGGVKARNAFQQLKTNAITIQSHYRRRVARKHYLATKKAIILTQAHARGFLIRREIERKTEACCKIQNYFRAYLLMNEKVKEYKDMKNAATKVQALWRGRTARLQFKQQASAIISAQAKVRGCLVRKRYLRKKSAAVVLQSRYRATRDMHYQRHIYLVTRGAIVTLQSTVRGHRVRQELKRMNSAATRIQTCYRCYYARTRYLHLQRCAVVIQRRYRAWSLGCQVMLAYKQTRDAVFVIQRFARGQLVRKEVCKMTQAAVTIQASYKRYRVQKAYLALRKAILNIQHRFRATRKAQEVRGAYLLKKECAIRLQSAFRAAKCVKQYQRQRQAAMVIQTHWRAVLCSREARKRYHRVRGSIITIQAFVRGFHTRREVKREKAAIKIQAWWKGSTQKQFFLKSKSAATTLQATFRMLAAKRNYDILKTTVVYLQRLVRANQLCRRHIKQYKTTRGAIITLQAAVRGYRVRKELKTRHKSATRIQAMYRMHSARREYLKIVRSVLVIQRRRRATIMGREAKSEYHHLRSSVILLQSHLRGLVTRRNYHNLCKKIILVQSLVRGFQARNAYLRKRKAAFAIQKRYRAYTQGSAVRKVYHLQRDACLTVQSSVRAWVCRQRYLKLREATKVIQTYYRATACARKQRQVYLELRRVVVTIQAFTRGWVARREMKRYRASTTIQSWWRMFVIRCWYIHQRCCIVKLQSLIRMWSCRRRYVALQGAAVTVQRRIRANQLCKKQSDLFMEIKGSCFMIQHCYRFYRQRRLIKKMLESVSTLKNASLTVQHRFRANQLGKSIRREYLTLKSTTILLQAVYRGRQARAFVGRLRAAIVIQSCYRGYRQRSEYNSLKTATIKMQALTRGKQTCREYKKLRAAAVIIQRLHRANIKGYLQRKIFLAQKNSAVVIQSSFRGYKRRIQYQLLKQNAIKVQSLVRRNIARKAYVTLRSAVLLIQCRERARVHGFIQRNSFLMLKKNAILLQSRFRAKRERTHFLKKKNAAIKIQALARGKSAREAYIRSQKAVIVLQRRERARVLGKREREKFLKTRKAVIMIQSIARCRQQRTRYLTLRLAVISLQARARGKAAQSYYQKLRAAALVLQCRERARVLGKRTREEYLTRRKSAILIQSCARGYQQRTRYGKLRDATIVVQARVRGKHARDAYWKTRAAAVVIQRRERARVLRKDQREKFQQQRKSVVLIQSATRCYQQRTRYLRVKHAATVIQAHVRGKRVRDLNKKFCKAAVVIQNWQRARILGKLEREFFLTKKRCAVTIQSWVKGCRERQRYNYLRSSTVTIQAFVRGYQQRRRYCGMKAAVICIQQRYRAYTLGREVLARYQEMKNAAIIIQSYYRGHCARQAVKRIQASITIQTAYRRFVARREYLNLRRAAVYIQSIQRMTYEQKQYQKLRNITLKLQQRVRANQLGRKVKDEYNETRCKIIYIQALWRGYKARENVRRIKSTRVLQRRYRACVKARRVRTQFVFMKTTVINVQACYRGNIARRQFKREKAARTIQAYVRGYQARKLIMKLQEEKAARLLRFSAAVYANLMIIRLQRAYRKARAVALFKARMDRLVFLQQWWRAKLRRLSYLRARYLVRLVQRRWRERLALKNQSATKIQAVVRSFLAKRAAEKQKEAILIIQCTWRGYCVRKQFNSKKFKKARQRILQANSNVTEPMKLCNRTRSALDYLLKCKNLTTVREALVHLEVASRLSHKCTWQLVMDNALSVIFKVVRDSNRSLAHVNLIKLALDIFINVSKCPTTKDAVVTKEPNSLDTLVELACIFREKHEIFLKVTKLLTILCENEGIRESLLSMKKSVTKIKSIYTLTKRKHDFEIKRSTAKIKRLNMSTQNVKKIDNTSTVNPLSAITNLMETLSIDI